MTEPVHYFTDDLIDAIDAEQDDGECRVGVPGIEHQLNKRGMTVTGWIKVGECDPHDGQRMVCTNGEDVWLNTWMPKYHLNDPWVRGIARERATHWFPILDIPKA
jgi:hypothetical protein